MLGKGISGSYTINKPKTNVPIPKLPVFYNIHKKNMYNAKGYKLTTKYLANSKYYKIKKNFYTIGETYVPQEVEAQKV